jgi:hypothetical protein
VLALTIWDPLVAVEGPGAGLFALFFLNGVFVLLFVASAILFRRAGDTEPEPG